MDNYVIGEDGNWYPSDYYHNLHGHMTAALINSTYHDWMFFSRGRLRYSDDEYYRYMTLGIHLTLNRIIIYAGLEGYYEHGNGD